MGSNRRRFGMLMASRFTWNTTVSLGGTAGFGLWVGSSGISIVPITFARKGTPYTVQ